MRNEETMIIVAVNLAGFEASTPEYTSQKHYL
jgi:hypothetical protein